jgi:hypothetical protein
MSLTKVSFSMINGAWFNVLDYGAKGDGTTNDTAAIQACINDAVAAGGGAVFLPTGTYKITSAISVISNKISIYGEGADATVIQALSCNGINIRTPSGDKNTQFFEDFALVGAAGSTANWAAIESVLPPGGTSGVDSRDGLHFNRLKIYDWNQGFLISDTWEWSIQLCKIQKVRNPIQLGNYAMVGRILNNYMVFENGDSHGGGALPYAINMLGPVCEGPVIQGNQMYGFGRGLSITNSVFVNFVFNDVYATEYGVYVGTANNLFYCAGNYFELNQNNSVGVYIRPSNVEINSENVIHANNFIGSGGTGVTGIRTGDPATQYAWHNDIQFNLFTDMTGYDILLEEGAGKTNIANNRCNSTSTTSSIRINNVYGAPVTVSQNWCYKDIYINNAPDLTSGKILLNQNTENNSYQAWRQTSVPTTGTWRVGDIVYNSTPASAAYIGWTCTVAGTPGTWKTFGLIS